MKIIEWIKEHKLSFFFLLIIAFLLLKNYLPGYFLSPRRLSMTEPMVDKSFDEDFGSRISGSSLESLEAPVPPITPEAPPQPEIEERLVVETSSLSLLVEDVSQKADQLIGYAEEKGGYLVSSSLTRPEEAPLATVIIRLPNEELRLALAHFRNLAVRVTSESLQGRDVTDQYVDLQARLETLERTKAKFEEILNGAEEVEDILQVQRELVNLQRQIDNLKGQQQYLEKTAQMAKLTVYLSSDEWALPYRPAKPFRAKVIFKQAVRSLVLNLRGVVKLAIWIVVYSPVWLSILLVIFLVNRIKKAHQK